MRHQGITMLIFAGMEPEADSDKEEEPAHLLTAWLGELDTLKKVNNCPGCQIGDQGFYITPLLLQGLDSQQTKNNSGYGTVVRRDRAALTGVDKSQYRCSLINIEHSQDDELDAILGELSELETQFSKEITSDIRGAEEGGRKRSSDESSQGLYTGSSVVSSSVASAPGSRDMVTSSGASGSRNHSPDTDSAFCDNLSLLSSCSAASTENSSTVVRAGGSREEQEARLKAEKIKIAIEKIKEASVKKLFIKVFTCDGSAKSLLVDEKMTVGHVTRILAEKNHVSLDPKWALVELVPDLYMERVYEDNEMLVENCLLWKVDSKNTLWFIERPEKFDLFSRPEVYLLGSSSSQRGDQMEEHSRQELLEEYFSSSGVGAPEVEGNIWLKADGKKSWKKFFFVLRTSGLYYAPKGKKSSKDLVCLTTFDVNQVYYGIGWKGKYKAPSEYCFGIKHPNIQAKNPKYIKYLCVDSQKELHQWVTGIRVAKNGRYLFDNYRGIVEEITHADIDILTAKRFSVNSGNGLKMLPVTPEKASGQLLTPSSENKSLASALSSGIESDMSQGSAGSKAGVRGASEETSVAGDMQSVSGASERRESNGHTPVGTLERGLNLRRSFSRSSRSSSSSGCLSDKSGQFELGFESDFPAGGTIKKRPSAAARLPLTSTTWGMVRESDTGDMDVVDNGDSGSMAGTLRRKAMRNNSTVSKKSLDQEPRTANVSSQDHDQSHSDPMSSAFEASLSSLAVEEEGLPLPPPPRVDSVTSLNTAEDIDLLPPPPPDMCLPEVTPAPGHYHVSPVSSLPPPAPAPKPVTQQNKPSIVQNSVSTLKKTNNGGGQMQKPSRRISFDDHVQMIEAPRQQTPTPPPPLPEPSPAPPSEPVMKYSPQGPIRNNPKKLSANENYNSLPRTFLDNLQKVMSKKWQVAEKCRQNESPSPYEVLGFRDESVAAVGQPAMSSKNSAIGAWVLETQMYAGSPYDPPAPHHPPHHGAHHPPLNHHPGPPHGHHVSQHVPSYQVENAVPRGGYVTVPELSDYGHYDVYNNRQQLYNNGHHQPQQQQQQQHYHQQQQPVVLREPEPEANYVDPSRLRANKMLTKRPPPPPRRSENTHLSNNMI